jgi:hypothetical protein
MAKQSSLDQYTGYDEEGNRVCTVTLDPKNDRLFVSGNRQEAVNWKDKKGEEADEPPLFYIKIVDDEETK